MSELRKHETTISCIQKWKIKESNKCKDKEIEKQTKTNEYIQKEHKKKEKWFKTFLSFRMLRYFGKENFESHPLAFGSFISFDYCHIIRAKGRRKELLHRTAETKKTTIDTFH